MRTELIRATKPPALPQRRRSCGPGPLAWRRGGGSDSWASRSPSFRSSLCSSVKADARERLGRHRWRWSGYCRDGAVFERLQVRWGRDAGRFFVFVLRGCALVCCNRREPPATMGRPPHPGAHRWPNRSRSCWPAACWPGRGGPASTLRHCRGWASKPVIHPVRDDTMAARGRDRDRHGTSLLADPLAGGKRCGRGPARCARRRPRGGAVRPVSERVAGRGLRPALRATSMSWSPPP